VAQNVVSYGKKFAITEVAQHYDPFDGFVNDTTEFSARVDMATSLGLGTATTWGAAWDRGSDNHRRPYNGGRVVKWVDSSGVIKTSVNMMPANAQNISQTASAEIDPPTATNTYLPAMSNDAIDNSLAEVAKAFHFREFGNGAANAGTLSETFPDASMYSAADEIAYVMDDGLSSLSAYANTHNSSYGLSVDVTNKTFYITFIGTGISWISGSNATGTHLTWAQNLPYGTHVLSFIVDGTNVWDGVVSIDGITVKDNFGSSGSAEIYKYPPLSDISFHQPKMPPIPEDAVVIADYMLMADFVAVGAVGGQYISKGVRLVNCSRDHFYDAPSALAGPNINRIAFPGLNVEGTTTLADNHAGYLQLPFFGKEVVFRGYQPSDRLAGDISIDGSTISSGLTRSSGAPYWGGYVTGINTSGTIGSHVWKGLSLATKNFSVQGSEIACKIHTSSHYQTFETPFLHELVGGDRNMEQINLVVTSDGKTWDEVTRDVSYLGNIELQASASNSEGSWTGNATTPIIFDEFRGIYTLSLSDHENWNKNWAIAYDRFICLKAGSYEIMVQLLIMETTGGMTSLYKNGQIVQQAHPPNVNNGHIKMLMMHADTNVERGDYFQIYGQYHGDDFAPTLTIKKI